MPTVNAPSSKLATSGTTGAYAVLAKPISASQTVYVRAYVKHSSGSVYYSPTIVKIVIP